MSHPLDPLTEAEIAAAIGILRDAAGLPASSRFPIVRLEEPTKAALRRYAGGEALPRLAFLLVLDAETGASHEHIVDLGLSRAVSSKLLPNAKAPYGQPPVTIEEFMRCDRIVKADAGWRAAMRRRGLSEHDMEMAQIDPFSSGFFDREFERGRRIVRAVSYFREDIKDNGYAHPIEGVVAVVDLIDNRVTDLIDDPDVIPVPRKKRNYGTADLPPPRTDLKPLNIVQPDGPSFQVDGWKVDWQKWSFRVGFTPREGLVLHQLAYRDGDRTRPVIHRASITEMVVPYADPTTNHYWKSAFDAGEYGLGTLANSLELGCDCLGNIHYFDVPAADPSGSPFLMKNAICMHEEDYGILWKHYEFRNGLFEVRRSYKGSMHGLPHAVKDRALTKGIRTTLGSPLFADFVPDTDEIFVERLRANGAIVIGKTNIPELGLGSQTYNPVFGTTGNAYDPTKTCGGSSGGASVGVALRMLPVADGSDFAGSLRNPAGWNNIFGFRPSVGRVPFGPTNEVFMQSLGYDGPMARTVGDLAMLLSVMAGYDDRAPMSLTDNPARFTEPLKRDMKGVRIGWLGDLGGVPMEAGMLELCLSGLRRLEATGCTIDEATLSAGRDGIWDSFVKLRQGFVAGGLVGLYNDPAKRTKLKPEAIWEIEGGLRLSAIDLFAASEQRSAVYQAFRTSLQRFDFLAMPTAQVFPFDAKVRWPTEVAGVEMDSYHRWMEIVAGPSLAGLPTVAVPAGFGAGGLPSGIQLIGRNQGDFEVLQLAYAYEQVSGSVLSLLPPLLAG